MDQQGSPLGASSGGTKVTSVPAPPRTENPGAVASDSLAAESYRKDGAFSENTGGAPSSVKGSSSTMTNEDTSAARTIPPAPDADARESQDAWDESSKLKGASGLKYAEGVGGQGQFDGTHSQAGYYGGPSGGSGGSGQAGSIGGDPSSRSSGATSQQAYPSAGSAGGNYGSGGSGPGASTASGTASANDGAAPTYVGSVTRGFQAEQDLKPKGTNITSGIDDQNAPNASFSAEVGSQNDPGRFAEQKLQKHNAQEGIDAAGGPRQTGIESGGVGYSNLDTDRQA